MEARFYGVRGSIAVSGPDYHRAGGNTSCVGVEHDGHRLVLDGGTGLRELGNDLGGPVKVTVLFSHYHWDHIQGVPFFVPAYHPASDVSFAGVRFGDDGVRELLGRQMSAPTFPVGLDALAGAKHFIDHAPGATFEVGPFRISCTELPHPNGVAAFRIEADGKSLVYATDAEHGLGEDIDPRLVELAAGADLLIHDAQYMEDEYAGKRGPARRGWGHSTWNEAVEAARRCGIQRLALFHHDPARGDDELEQMEADARRILPGAFAARQGGSIEI